MSKDIRQQYDDVSEAFIDNHIDKNQVNRAKMREFVGEDLSGKLLLDLCCGDGYDANHYRSLGAIVQGLDASGALISKAQKDYSEIVFTEGFAESMPYADESFDIVTSKYAIMTSHDMSHIFDEVFRVLKPGGIFIYLVTHPIRQFMERKNLASDYFKQKEVESNILDNTVTVIEPTHTLNEYFNKDFFSRFDVHDFLECHDPGAEQIYGGKYPGFMIVKCTKR